MSSPYLSLYLCPSLSHHPLWGKSAACTVGLEANLWRGPCSEESPYKPALLETDP